VKTIRSCSRATAAIEVSSSRVKTLPHGFDGVFTTIARVRGPIALDSAVESSVQSGASRRTSFTFTSSDAKVFTW
jgi:hypothetical protein